MSAPSTSSLKGKVAIVTGASNGIGAGIAKALAAAGVKVVINGRDSSRLEHIKADIVKAGGAATSHVGDVRHEAVHKELVELAISSYGALHFAINNAGIGHFGGIETTPGNVVDDVLDINVKSVLFGLKHQLPAIGRFSSEDDWGRIINVSSAAAKHSSSMAGALVYSVSKVAVDQATRLGAAAGKPHHVLVNAISPGPVYTGQVKAMADANGVSQEALTSQMNFVGKGADVGVIANFVLFLLGKGGDYIDGAILPIDGGMAVL